MKEFKMPSRINNITSFIQKSELISIKPEEVKELGLPKRVEEMIGVINKITYPQQGMCSLVSIIESDKGKFILKMAKGVYRGDELYAEYIAMRSLLNTSIPVPLTYDFFKEEDLYYLLRECSEGIPLNTIFNESEDKNQRLYMIKKMATALCGIHKLNSLNNSFEEFINAQFYFAEQHYKNNVIDISDFVFDGEKIEPKIVLKWLKENKPKQGKTCIIHGDYRPKNILWKDNKIVSIVDWAFCDIGDPYYDFAILKDYFRNDEEKEAFIEWYGIESFDEERLNFYCKMVPFINI